MAKRKKTKRVGTVSRQQNVKQNVNVKVNINHSSKKVNRDDRVKLMPNRMLRTAPHLQHHQIEFMKFGPQVHFIAPSKAVNVGSLLDHQVGASVPSYDSQRYSIVSDSRTQPVIVETNPNSITQSSVARRFINSMNLNDPYNPMLQRSAYDVEKEANASMDYLKSKPSAIPEVSLLMQRNTSPFVTPFSIRKRDSSSSLSLSSLSSPLPSSNENIVSAAAEPTSVPTSRERYPQTEYRIRKRENESLKNQVAYVPEMQRELRNGKVISVKPHTRERTIEKRSLEK